MAHHRSIHAPKRASYNFSLEEEKKDVGIQLTERQLQLQRKRQEQRKRPFETQSNRVCDDRTEPKPRSSVSTTVAHSDQRAFLKRVLANKRNRAAKSTVAPSSSDQRAYLKHILSSKDAKRDDGSSGSSAATSTQHVEDQKALLRKVLNKSVARQQDSGENERAASTVAGRTTMEGADVMTATEKNTVKEPPKPSKTQSRSVLLIDAVAEKEHEETKTDSEYGPQSTLVSTRMPDSEGYAAFLSVLKREVAGDHTVLWKSFQQLFHDEVPEATEKPPRVKFDSKTKKALTEMNLYLKRSYDVESVSETQLVNDRKLAKEGEPEDTNRRGSLALSRASSLTTRQHLEVAKRRLVAKDEESRRQSIESAATSKVTVIREERTSDDYKLPEWPDDNSDQPARVSLDSVEEDTHCSNKENVDGQSPQADQNKDHSSADKGLNESENITSIEPDDGDHPQTYERKKSWLTVHREKQAMKEKSLLDQTADPLPDQESSLTEETQSESSASIVVRSLLSRRESGVSLGRRTSLLDTVMEDDRIKPEGSLCSLPGNEDFLSLSNVGTRSECVVPWANVKLRSAPRPVIHSKERANAETTNATSWRDPQAEMDDERPPWTPVKLRSVAQQNGPPDESEDKQDTLAFRQLLRKVPSELNAVKRKEKQAAMIESGITKTPEQKSLADLSWVPVQTQAAPSETDENSVFGICDGDEINLNSLPSEAFGPDGDATIVHLDRIPGMPEDHKMSVVIGKRILLTSRTVDEAQLSRVTWRVARSDVKSLTLDMAEKQADMMLVNSKSKSLVFDSAEGCLQFANAFYETTNNQIVEAGRRLEPAEGTTESVPNQGATSSAEQLSEEEQRLLEAFREKRRTKAPEEAMREAMAEKTIGFGGDGSMKDADTGSNPATVLSDEEEKVASTYRKMLKFSIPPEAVRHKMTKDGVSEKIVASVLGKPAEEAKTASEGLTEEESKIADTYRKMLKMRVPPEAVRHKMTKDQVDRRIVDTVLGSNTEGKEPSQQPKISLSEEEEKLAASYRKMLKMMIPADAVRHKMKRDQASRNVIVAVFGPEAEESEGGKADEKVSLSESEEAIASSYRKMLKMMIPPDAVRHKMKKDRVDPKIVLVVLGADPNEEKKDKKPKSSLSEADEQVAATYRKMLRMKVPRDGVRHKMIKNGVSENIMEAVLGADLKKAKAKAVVSNKATSKSKLVHLHWTPLSGEALDNSVWRASKKRKVSVAQPEGSDISKLVELFQKKTNNRKATSGDGTSSDGKGPEMAKLLDLNRANNLAISLKAFKEFSHSELADTIAHLDPMRKITGERVQFVKDLLPTPAEVQDIKAYRGDDSRLVPAEQFFTKIVKIQRLQTKVQVMQTMNTLNDNATALGESFVLLERVCSQVMNSEKLEEVLDMVLQIGNIMNEGTRTGGAAGFKFDSLLKLTQTKSSDGKMTVLDYIVMIFVAKEKRETLQLTLDFPDCQVASRMLTAEMVGEVTTMKTALKKCETELEHLRRDIGKATGNDQADAHAAVMAAIRKKALGGEQKDEAKSFPKRAAFLEAIEARRSPEPTPVKAPIAETKEKSPFVAKDGSLKSGIQRLEAFVMDAKTALKNLEEDRDRAIDACKSLSRYCGESGGERATPSLLGILSQFASNLESAVKKHDERKEAEQRREAAAQKKKEQQGMKPETRQIKDKQVKTSTATPNTCGQSLVLMVNELLKEAPQEAKEDFKKGVVYEDPDEKLRAIYQKERESLGIFVPPDARKPSQVDLLIAIKKRRERAEGRATSKQNSEISNEAEDNAESK